jgi:hypothetical protein
MGLLYDSLTLQNRITGKNEFSKEKIIRNKFWTEKKTKNYLNSNPKISKFKTQIVLILTILPNCTTKKLSKNNNPAYFRGRFVKKYEIYAWINAFLLGQTSKNSKM